ncbi:strictosidine synthase [Mycobacteroides stephanolepidis]|uniref:Strictosidine synthase n=1 Tax=[Mycobacterium] stephanolepidis TaxID=1520670 RepID=A0A1Z4ETB3_9MYCO|nr:SMP-30/gluconolactonase/LRE family protein [[Mycobacterium] stephanolepidis]BAX96206.1 strictosidine synthase [[Mycobacterium] stephanolepidis]
MGTHAMGPVSRIELPGVGPEDVIVDTEGSLYTGLEDGRVVRISPEGQCDVLTITDGRPLGLEWSHDGRLLVCDPFRGLLAVDITSGTLSTLVHEVDGVPMRFCSNAAAAPDGTIYFTDSSQRFGFEHNMADVLEHSCTGRLLRLSPNGIVEVLLDGLAFANGLALAADKSYLVVAETFEYRLTRYWLAGPRAGSAEPLIDNLPGIPDNLSIGSDGLFWVALSIPRNAALDALLPKHGLLRQIAYALPARLQPQPARTLWVLAVDGLGCIHFDLQTSGEEYALVTGVCEQAGRVYLSSLNESALAVFDLAHLTALVPYATLA